MISRRSNGTTKPVPEASSIEPADDRRGPALEDPEDASFGSAVGDPLDARDHAVAVHGLIQVAAGDEDVAGHSFERAVRHDEAKPARVCHHASDDQVHPVGQAEAVAPRLDEDRRARRGPSAAASARSLLARYLEPLEELPRRRGMVDFFPNQLQQLFVIQHVFILSGNQGSGRES